MKKSEGKVKTIERTDGAIKIYGWFKDGKLAVIIMKRDNNNNYQISEIIKEGRITNIF